MKKRGQISLDLMLTLLAVLMFVQLFQAFSGEFTVSQRTMSIRNQETEIATNIRALVANTSGFNDGNITVSFKVPFIFDPEKSGGQDCKIEFIGQTPPVVRVSYTMSDLIPQKDIMVEKKMYSVPSHLFVPAKTFYCGSIMNFDVNAI